MKMTYLIISILAKQAMLALVVGLIALAMASAYMVFTGALTFTGGVFVSASAMTMIISIMEGAAVGSFLVGIGMNFLGLYKLKQAGLLDIAAADKFGELQRAMDKAKGAFKRKQDPVTV